MRPEDYSYMKIHPIVALLLAWVLPVSELSAQSLESGSFRKGVPSTAGDRKNIPANKEDVRAKEDVFLKRLTNEGVPDKEFKYGIISATGKVIAEPGIWSDIEPVGEGYCAVRKDRKYGYIDENGKLRIPVQFDNAGRFSEGLAAVIDGKWGYIDKRGKFVIEPEFSDAAEFSEGLACVAVGDKYGFIDKTGKLVIEPTHKGGGSFHSGVAKVSDENVNAWTYIDRKGNVLFKRDMCGHFSDGYALAFEGIGRVYVDKTGRTAFGGRQFPYACDFTEGLASVSLDRKTFGYIDKTGEFVINPVFDNATEFSEGLATVQQDRKWKYIDKTGQTVIDIGLESAFEFHNGFALCKKDGKWIMINHQGKILSSIEPPLEVHYGTVPYGMIVVKRESAPNHSKGPVLVPADCP